MRSALGEKSGHPQPIGNMRLGEITQGVIEGIQRRQENQDRALGHSYIKRWGDEEEPAKGKNSQ